MVLYGLFPKWTTLISGYVEQDYQFDQLYSLVEHTASKICSIVLHRFSYMVYFLSGQHLPKGDVVSWTALICEYDEYGYVEELQYMLI